MLQNNVSKKSFPVCVPLNQEPPGQRENFEKIIFLHLNPSVFWLMYFCPDQGLFKVYSQKTIQQTV